MLPRVFTRIVPALSVVPELPAMIERPVVPSVMPPAVLALEDTTFRPEFKIPTKFRLPPLLNEIEMPL